MKKPVSAAQGWALHAATCASRSEPIVALQRHQVRRRLGIDDDQVAGDAAPGPQAQRLRQRAQQAEALGDAGRDEHDRPIARDAEAPQQAPVADLARRGARAHAGG